MHKAMIAIAVAPVVVVAGWPTPIPEQPGYDRWGPRAPA